MIKDLPLSLIRTDGDTQPRAAGLDPNAVADYAELMRDGVEFLPPIVFFDATDYWLAHGFHRLAAREAAGFNEISAEIHMGTREDAQWYSYGANKDNGLPRSNEDKQRAVKAALEHRKSAGLSDRQIARHVGVNHDTVSAWRKKIKPHLSESDRYKPRTAIRDGKEYQINVSNIGKHGRRVPSKRPQAEGAVDEPEPRIALAEESRPEPMAPPEAELPPGTEPTDDVASHADPEAQAGPDSGTASNGMETELSDGATREESGGLGRKTESAEEALEQHTYPANEPTPIEEVSVEIDETREHLAPLTEPAKPPAPAVGSRQNDEQSMPNLTRITSEFQEAARDFVTLTKSLEADGQPNAAREHLELALAFLKPRMREMEELKTRRRKAA